MTEVFNQQWAAEYRRNLRNRPTKAEYRLWFYLRGDQTFGIRFRRQYSIGGYIADFYVPRLRLVIEIDGLYHNDPDIQNYDRKRTDYFSGLGLHTVRFTNDEIFNDIVEVLKRLHVIVLARAQTPPLKKRGIGGVELQ